nr:MAG TPA: hypothetical protein [Caudoviricetes sp.]
MQLVVQPASKIKSYAKPRGVKKAPVIPTPSPL